jgi:hypothetical protein
MSRFIPVQEVIKLPMLGSNDLLMRSKGRYLTWAKWVWDDMNLSSMKVAERQYFQINKRTNSIDLPCDFTQLSSVNIVHCGVFYPVYRNESIRQNDYTEVASAKDCACEYKCGYKMCNTIKGYEAVKTVLCDKNPDGSDVSFTCIERKAIDGNGFLYTQTQYPLRVYLSGVWVETILHTENTKLCKVEVDEHGCCCDTEENINNICGACGLDDSQDAIPFGGDANNPPNVKDNKWIYYCDNKADWFSVQCGNFSRGLPRECNNVYNISELGNRLIFPHNFGFDRVMIRYYVDPNLNDMQIPRIAVDTFVNGLLWFDKKYSSNAKDQALAAIFERKYALMKFGLLRELNKYRIAELAKIIAPKKYLPQTTLGWGNFYFGSAPYGDGYGYGNSILNSW